MRPWNDGPYWKHGRYHDYKGSRMDVGVRFPAGLAYLSDGAPVDVFFERVPTLNVAPGTWRGSTPLSDPDTGPNDAATCYPATSSLRRNCGTASGTWHRP